MERGNKNFKCEKAEGMGKDVYGKKIIFCIIKRKKVLERTKNMESHLRSEEKKIQRKNKSKKR